MRGSEGGRCRGVEQTPNELMIRQIPLVEFADSARRFAERHDISGFQRVNLDNDEFSVTVIWHGLRFAEFVAARLVDFLVHMVESPYTRAELVTEARRLVMANSGILDSVGPTAMPPDCVSVSTSPECRWTSTSKASTRSSATSPAAQRCSADEAAQRTAAASSP